MSPEDRDEARKALKAMLAESCPIDVQAELRALYAMTPQELAAHKERLMSCFLNPPLGDIDDNRPDPFMVAALNYMRKHKCKWSEAITAVTAPAKGQS